MIQNFLEIPKIWVKTEIWYLRTGSASIRPSVRPLVTRPPARSSIHPRTLRPSARLTPHTSCVGSKASVQTHKRNNWSTPWNNEHVQLFGLRFSIFQNYLGGVRISNFIFQTDLFWGGVRISGFEFDFRQNIFRVFEFRFFVSNTIVLFVDVALRAASILKNRVFICNISFSSHKTPLFGWIWASRVL